MVTLRNKELYIGSSEPLHFRTAKHQALLLYRTELRSQQSPSESANEVLDMSPLRRKPQHQNCLYTP